jgi:gliding motility-associated-like protein
MKLLSRIIACYALIACMAWDAALGQITANADYKQEARYKTDSLYVFNSTSVAALTAKFSDGSPSTYEWSKFDSISTRDFVLIPGVTSATISGLTWGGYRVKVTNTATSVPETYTAWVFIDKFAVKLDHDASGYVKVNYSFCDHVQLNVINTPNGEYRYYNLLENKFDTIANKYWYKWQNDYKAFKWDSLTTKFYDYSPPSVATSTTYKVIAKDRFGRSVEATVLYKSIIPKAKFEFKADSISAASDTTYPAPCKMKFTNLSQVATKFTWYTGDHYTAGQDTLYFTDTTSVLHTYYIPKTYHIVLVAQSAEQCVDSMSQNITLAEASLGEASSGDGSSTQVNIVNVLTPNNDGKNDNFKPKNISIEHFRFTVFSRWGKKIYSYEGDDMGRGWPGWNGHINGHENSQIATDGVYYYVLEVLPWPTDPSVTAAKKTSSTSATLSKGNSGFLYLFGPH